MKRRIPLVRYMDPIHDTDVDMINYVVTCADRDGWREPVLCYSETNALFSIPYSARRIDLLLSSTPVRGAVELRHDASHGQSRLYLDGAPINSYWALDNAVRDLGGRAWAWIQY